MVLLSSHSPGGNRDHAMGAAAGDPRGGEKPMESLMGHQAGAFGKPVVSFGDDSVIELALREVYSNYYGHCTTFRVRKDGSLNPISRVEGSLKLNQPIGITKELGQTPLEAQMLRDMSPSDPSIISLCPHYGD